jgi:hypothetical protein
MCSLPGMDTPHWRRHGDASSLSPKYDVKVTSREFGRSFGPQTRRTAEPLGGAQCLERYLERLEGALFVGVGEDATVYCWVCRGRLRCSTDVCKGVARPLGLLESYFAKTLT